MHEVMSAGDATWSVSTGLGACIAGAVYEVGRPKRYTAEEAAQLDAEWRDFGTLCTEPQSLKRTCVLGEARCCTRTASCSAACQWAQEV